MMDSNMDDTAAESPAGEKSEDAGATSMQDELEGPAEDVRQALRGVMDPELGINIVDLGLVYGIEVDGGSAHVTMSLTSPGCPAGGQILGGAKAAAESVEGVEAAVVSLVWKPFWTPERIDPKVRAMMGF
jgi:metal-sulfur cluster biosynthetic enzyme